MFLTNMILAVFTTSPSTANQKVESLPDRDKSLCREIFQKLIPHCTGRWVDASQPKTNPVYELTFKEGLSWRHIEKEFNNLKACVEGLPDLIKFINAWSRQISDMRQAYHELLDLESLLSKSKIGNNFHPDQYALSKQSLTKIRRQIDDVRDKIKSLLDQAHKNLASHLNDSQIISNDDCKRHLKYIEKNWDRLCVFLDTDCPFDFENDITRLTVQVKPITNDSKTTRTTKVSKATQAILTIEEISLDITSSTDLNGFVSQPKKLKLGRRASYGPPTTPSHSRRVSVSLNQDGLIDNEVQEKTKAYFNDIALIAINTINDALAKNGDLNDITRVLNNQNKNLFSSLTAYIFATNPYA